MKGGVLDVRAMRPAEIRQALAWAGEEGWNPGADDGACFAVTDPGGLFMGWLDGRPVGCFAALAYGDRFGFLGIYIVAKEFRGRGYGLQLWNAGMRYLGERIVGLDGVLAQQENYRRSGFVAAHPQLRHAGRIDADPPGDPPGDPGLVPLADLPVESIMALDRQFFLAPREAFLRCWLDPARRPGFAIRRDGRLTGYGVIRRSQDGYRVGPLFAANEADAELLLRALAAAVPRGAVLFIDIPAPNAAGVALARRFGMEPVFETVRMYRGGDPGLPLSRIFGITTLEQG